MTINITYNLTFEICLKMLWLQFVYFEKKINAFDGRNNPTVG